MSQSTTITSKLFIIGNNTPVESNLETVDVTSKLELPDDPPTIIEANKSPITCKSFATTESGY